MDALQQNTILQGKYKYKILKKLGQGTFGITYLATSKASMEGPLGIIETEVKVAIKEFFMRDINGREGTVVTCGSKGGIYDDYKKKFIREATNLGKLHHPNIIKVLESFKANNTVYYAMEYIGGGSLDDYIQRKGTLPESETVKIAKQIGEALSFMHGKRMLHLDLKPNNIMMRENGEPVLIDFGLSKQYDEEGNPESSTSVGAGTPGYAPIEQASYREGKDFPVTMDVYALGATMFKMLTGKRVPEASYIFNRGFPNDELQEHKVSDHLAACIVKAMEPRMDDRYQTVKDFIAAIGGEGYVAPEEDEETVEDEEVTVNAEDIPVEGDAEDVEVVPQDDEDEIVEVYPDDEESVSIPEPPQPVDTPTKGIKNMLLAILGLVVIGAGIYWIASSMNHKNVNHKNESGAVEQKVVDEYVCPDGNHPHAIDLGLPSGTKWACCNVGANKPEEAGGYYAWGETEEKDDYAESTYAYYKDGDYQNLGDDIAGTDDYDVAHVKWGGSWVMPSRKQQDELRENCTYEWTTVNGVKGGKFTSKKNGASIFLPAAGNRWGGGLYYAGSYGGYWSSTQDPSLSDNAYYLGFHSSNADWYNYYRYGGHTVRPVSR